MTEAPSRPSSPDGSGTAADLTTDEMEHVLTAAGPAAALDRLIAHLDRAAEPRMLLDALLLKARHDLGLPPIQVEGFSSLPEPLRTQYEERYIEAIRRVGSGILEAGDIPLAWAYFRVIGETEAVSRAIEAFRPDQDFEKLAQVIEVAFNQGANPKRGYELILEHYGTCSAITALEQAPINDGATRAACVERLIRHLHGQLESNLRADFARQGRPAPAAGVSITEMIAAQDWLFADESYHIDISHLSSTVRYSVLCAESGVLGLAVDLCEYGRRLSPRLQFEGVAPFEQTFEDHRQYLRAMLGQEAERGIAHFRDKLEGYPREEPEALVAAQVLINLLVRGERLEEAITLAEERLTSVPESSLSCPGITELCRRTGQLDRLLKIARRQGNLVQYLSVRLTNPEPPGRGGQSP